MIVVALIVGVVLGYGLSSLREALRVKSCEDDCMAIRVLLRQRLDQDRLVSALFSETETLARRLVLQERLAETRNGVTK